MLKRFLLAAALGALPLLLFVPDAEAGTYVVRQCHHPAPQNHLHEGIGAASPTSGPYLLQAGPGICSNAGADHATGIFANSTALDGQYGSIRYTAPEGTMFTGVNLQARLRSEAGHRARLSTATGAGVELFRIAAGEPGVQGFRPVSYATSTGGFPQLIASLTCTTTSANCPTTGSGGESATEIRNMRFTLRDASPPTVEMGGTLFGGGWIRGTKTLRSDANDDGAGVRRLETRVEQELVAGALPRACALVPGTTDARTMTPCGDSAVQTISMDTTRAPFGDGVNSVEVCASDYGASPNRVCASRSVSVDNTEPVLAFERQREEDPEAIAVSAIEGTSGLDSSTASIEYRRVGAETWEPLATTLGGASLHARVDSTKVPSGVYELRASATDMAGNRAATSRRADGQPMVLTFPLKHQASLSARLGNGGDVHVVPYRTAGEVAGRLLTENGNPIANAEVTVTEEFAEGSLVDERVRTVKTDPKGRYRSTIPGGPSRDVSVAYPGSRRFIGDAAGGLDFDVNGDAVFSTSRRTVRAGKAVSFIGRVKRYYAQIPPGGKLVEVQVQSGDDWITLQQATGTDERGRVKLRHRFRRFYTKRVTFTFRLKVTSESGWPYRGAATSHKRKVTVVPRDRPRRR